MSDVCNNSSFPTASGVAISTPPKSPFGPVVNINSSSLQSLIEDRLTAWRALHDAIIALGKCRPHGRDYQTVPSSTYANGCTQFDERLATLVEVANATRDEIEHLYEGAQS